MKTNSKNEPLGIHSIRRLCAMLGCAPKGHAAFFVVNKPKTKKGTKTMHDLYYSHKQRSVMDTIAAARGDGPPLRLFALLENGEEVEYTQVDTKPEFNDAVFVGRGELSRVVPVNRMLD